MDSMHELFHFHIPGYRTWNTEYNILWIVHSCDCASSEFQYLDRSQVTDMGEWVSFDQWEAVICENWPITGQDINKSLTLWHTSREMFQNWRNVAQLTTKCISSSYWLHNWIESLQVKTHFFSCMFLLFLLIISKLYWDNHTVEEWISRIFYPPTRVCNYFRNDVIVKIFKYPWLGLAFFSNSLSFVNLSYVKCQVIEFREKRESKSRWLSFIHSFIHS